MDIKLHHGNEQLTNLPVTNTIMSTRKQAKMAHKNDHSTSKKKKKITDHIFLKQQQTNNNNNKKHPKMLKLLKANKTRVEGRGWGDT